MTKIVPFAVAAMFLYAFIVAGLNAACGHCILEDETRGWSKPVSEETHHPEGR